MSGPTLSRDAGHGPEMGNRPLGRLRDPSPRPGAEAGAALPPARRGCFRKVGRAARTGGGSSRFLGLRAGPGVCSV